MEAFDGDPCRGRHAWQDDGDLQSRYPSTYPKTTEMHDSAPLTCRQREQCLTVKTLQVSHMHLTVSRVLNAQLNPLSHHGWPYHPSFVPPGFSSQKGQASSPSPGASAPLKALWPLSVPGWARLLSANALSGYRDHWAVTAPFMLNLALLQFNGGDCTKPTERPQKTRCRGLQN